MKNGMFKYWWTAFTLVTVFFDVLLRVIQLEDWKETALLMMLSGTIIYWMTLEK